MGVRLAARGRRPPRRRDARRTTSPRTRPRRGFAEPGGALGPELTAWAVLGLTRAGASPAGRSSTCRPEGELTGDRPRARRAGAARARPASRSALARLGAASGRAARSARRVNSTIWGSSRSAGRASRAPRARPLPAAPAGPSGGWSWYARGQPDSNDTAAAIQALRGAASAADRSAAALAYLRRLQRGRRLRADSGRGSDAQSTAWAIQAFVAAGKRPAPRRPLPPRLRRPDGSYRYSRAYASTPVWVTAQVLPR